MRVSALSCGQPLQRVHEYTYQGVDWQQEYLYDRWGNRRLNTNPSNTYGPGINNKDFTVNSANNRLGVPVGQPGTMTYDAVGNLTNDTYTGNGTRTYDSENKMTSAQGINAGAMQYYTYNADGQRTRRKIDGVETWQVYGFDGELLAEYAANASSISPQKEYGYRNGQLLITAEAPVGGGVQNVSWTSVSPTLQVTGNSLQKVSGTSSWYDAGAVSSQTISSGDGYVEFTPGNTTTWRMIGLGNGNGAIHYSDIEYAVFVGPSAGLQIYESGVLRGSFGTYAATDRLRVAVEGGVVKYRKNGALVYTSGVTPTYPLLVDTSFNTVYSAVYDVVISFGSVSNINWLVADQLGTPRMVFDKTGSLANVKRHDYLPFGEELVAAQGLRSTSLGYTGDTIRQKFTSKERDIETGLDYFVARYYASVQGRFTGADPFDINLERQATDDADEADALLRKYIKQPQHWNHYSYTLNNPLRYVDPDGLYEYETELLGQKIKVHIDDSIIKKDKGAIDRIKDNLQKAFDKINSGAANLSSDQIESLHSQNRIYVSNDFAIGTVGGTFYIPQQTAENPNLDKLTADIIHDSRHSEQIARGLNFNEETMIPMEMEASQFAVGVMNNIGGFAADTVKFYQEVSLTGHVRSGSRMKDKSTPGSRAKVFATMQKPQKRRN